MTGVQTCALPISSAPSRGTTYWFQFFCMVSFVPPLSSTHAQFFSSANCFQKNKTKQKKQVVETSVANNGPSQDSNHSDDYFRSKYVTLGFKPFSLSSICRITTYRIHSIALFEPLSNLGWCLSMITILTVKKPSHL